MDARNDVDPGRAWYDAMCAGDERAFEALFHAYYAPLCRFLLTIVDAPDVAEELAQELFLRLWRDREGRPVRGSVRAYLYVAARNAALNHVRHGRIHGAWQERARAAADGPHAEAAPSTPEDDAAAGELAAAVADALARLPERARQAATLRWQHQLSYAEIAQVMAISVKGVENQLNRVGKLLRERLVAFRP